MKKETTNLAEEFSLKKTSGFFADYGTGKEEVVDVEIRQLVPFENHPFKVLEDDSMEELMESIQQHGVSVPIIVRPKGRGIYEIVAGHRRSKACELVGIEKVPAFIRELDDEEAVFQMVNTNIQREQLLPSEKAFAYKMKLEAMKSQGERKDLTCDQVGHKLKTRELLAQDSKDSGVQIQRYIRLTELTQDFLDLTDSRKLPFNVAVELSYLSHSQQEEVGNNMDKLNLTPSSEQATKLKKYSKEGTLTEALIESILTESKDKPVKVSFKVETSKYFPKDTPKAEIEATITQLLEEWKARNNTKMK
ncbi:MAG: ParB/RepB/Spo0J family partition protein [Eubacteriales bacterium]